MTVKQLLENMTATELAYWMAYAKIDNEKYEVDNKPKTDSDEPNTLFENNIKEYMGNKKGIRVRKKVVPN